jgi:hypothetical protein
LRGRFRGLEDGGDDAIGRFIWSQVEPGSGETIEVTFACHAIRPSGAIGAASASTAARSTRVA